jgi:asparagine synthase (glutamine-hydrolysing)
VQTLGAENVRTYSIGMRGSIDLEYAKKVSNFLHTHHTEVFFTAEEGIASIPDVIKALESYDITTVRASVGMYLLAKWISKNTNDKVIFSGELSDELLCGYLYFHHAPNSKEAENESRRLVSEVYKYDALRADRCISCHGLELRVPFADKYVLEYCLGLSGNIKKPSGGVEKRHLREQFVGDLPEDILWRRKDGFSDGVSSMGKPWYSYIQEYVENRVDHNPECVSKEASYYKQIYDSLYPYYPKPIDEHWMPKWVNVDRSNPSGRIIKIASQIN